ncbi:SDR family NAD(P)-dependent oxidoreductase [Novosphingobium sp. B 225]|uniref:SDR family NAD(P)-dependent oxidoreductase n=1 Tax=Novosphingobium sp. B 225 TaxID=1961849 RepID=UPI000B4BC8E7|nr:SDR family NAD(P)-dependent oxidoreductase [Novosphingobium sp. B 225]
MSGRLEGKVCLITGTGGSMGGAAARLFAREGAKIVGCDLNPDTSRTCVEAVQAAGGEMVALEPCDLRDPEACSALVALALESFGKLDVLFNNAADAHIGWIEELSTEAFAATLDAEVNIVFNLTKAAWPALQKKGGSIINMASVSAWITYQALPGLAHSAGKGAVLSMTRHLALEGRHHGIRANSLSPGLIETGATRELLAMPEFAGPMIDKIMLARPGQPEEVAAAALFLASDESSFITATDIRIDGGTTAW